MPELDLDTFSNSIQPTDDVLLARLKHLELSESEREALRFAWGEIETHAEVFVTELYRRFLDTPSLSSVLSAKVRMSRLRELQLGYLRDLFCQPIDSEYLAGRIKIGLVHHRIRITPQWYLASYSHFICAHVDSLFALAANPSQGLDLIIALFKKVMFDAGVVLESYGMHEDAALLRHRNIGERPPSTGFNDGDTSDGEKSFASNVGDRGMTRIFLSAHDAKQRSEFIGLQAGDLERLRMVRDSFVGAAPSVLHDFYSFIHSVPELGDLVPEDQLDRLMRQVGSYWREFVEGHFDQTHAASRMRIGLMHERIGLCPPWYFIGVARQAIGFLRAIPRDRPDFADVLRSFFKGFFFDITFVIDAYMSARAETLTRSESYAAQLMAGMTSAVAVIDAQSRVIYANDVLLDLTGIEPALLYMMNIKDVIAPPEVLTLISNLRDQRIAKTTGTCRWGTTDFRVSVVELELHSERSQRPLALVFDDIGNLIQLSDEIEKDALQYKRLANQISAVLWKMKLPEETIVTISRQAIDITGYREVSFLGRARAWIDCVIPEDQTRVRACLTSLKPGGHASCEYRIRRADGLEIWVCSHLSRSRDEEGPPYVSAVTIDVTQGKLADQRRMTAIGQVAGGIAHVLNNTLTVIMGNLELHQSSISGVEIGGYLTAAVNACQKAADIVAELQGFSGGRVLQPTEFHMHRLVAELSDLIRESLDPSIRLIVRVEGDEWLCRADEKLLHIAIGHLIANSQQAMPAGGEIMLRVLQISRNTLSYDDPGFDKEWVELSVMDNGTGMSEEVRRRAPEPFFSTRNLAERNGLGLSFVYGFVTQSGGHLKIESEPGKGTTVSLRFPRHNPVANSFDVPEADSSVARVLLVEDNDAVRNMTARLLRQLGYSVLSASNSSEAMKAIERNSVDLLLSDISLGDGVDGIVLAHRLRRKLPDLGIVLMSGFATDANSQGVPSDWSVLSKPFSISKLNALFTRILRK